VTEPKDLVAIERPSVLASTMLRLTRNAEGAASALLGSVEQVTSTIAAEVADAVVARIDVDAIIARVDVDAIVRRVDIDALLARVDIDALLARVDVDALIARVDVDAVVGRVELAPVVNEVLDEVDIGAIVMESTGSITGGVVDTVRDQAVGADDMVERALDVLLLRRFWPGRSRRERDRSEGRPEQES
jgi:hypothetical protein